MTPSPTLRQVDAALAGVPDDYGVIVTDADGKVLADRPPLPNACAVVIVLGRKPPSFATP